MLQVSSRPGRTVGLFSSEVPRELLYALGCTPVRVFPTVGTATAAEAHLPRNFCALARLILAGFLEDDEPGLDAVIFTDEDDATRRLHDVWRECVPVPVWGFVEVPRAATPLAASRYADTLTRLAADLEAHTGQPLTTGGLRRAINVYNEQRSLLADLKHRWLTGTVDTTAYRRLRRMALTRDPVVANEQLRQALREHDKGTRGQGDKETRRLGNAAIPSISPPLLVSPSPHPLVSLSPSHPRLLLLAELAAPAGLVRLIEAHGARVVAEDSDLDERDLVGPVPAEAGTVKELLLALAQAYLARPPGPRMRDLPRRLEYLSGLVTERRITGAICAYSKFCDLYLAEFPVLQAHLKGLGVPVLLLGTYWPYGARPASTDGVFRVGDAAGHCPPFTGEGIRPALYFGRACGQIVRRVLDGEHSPSAGSGQRLAEGLEVYQRFVAGHRWMSRILWGGCRRCSYACPRTWWRCRPAS
ncbi:MAG: 2-hydroxyacyl-CoA dehydratase [Anaerolineae bacterium]